MKCCVLITALCAGLAGSMFGAAAEPTFAQRMGWGPEDRVVIFNNDDAGMSHGQNLGSIRSFEGGVLKSWTIMMPCSWVTEIRDYLEENPDVCAGLHITHTSEFGRYRWRPLVGRTVAPGLYDEDGYMWPSVAEVVEHATADEVEAELRAQIQMAEDMGIDITHYDTHMGTMNGSPEFFERYVNVAIEKGIPIRVAVNRIEGDISEERRARMEETAERLWDAGLPVLDYLHVSSYGWEKDEKLERYIDLIRTLPPGVTEVIVHAAYPTEDFNRITASGPTRYGDLLAMTDPRLKEAIEEEGVIVISWRELHEARKAVDE